MSGVPREVTDHSLKRKSGSKPVRQRSRRFDNKKRRAIEEEVGKLKVADFIIGRFCIQTG